MNARVSGIDDGRDVICPHCVISPSPFCPSCSRRFEKWQRRGRTRPRFSRVEKAFLLGMAATLAIVLAASAALPC